MQVDKIKEVFGHPNGLTSLDFFIQEVLPVMQIEEEEKDVLKTGAMLIFQYRKIRDLIQKEDFCVKTSLCIIRFRLLNEKLRYPITIIQDSQDKHCPQPLYLNIYPRKIKVKRFSEGFEYGQQKKTFNFNQPTIESNVKEVIQTLNSLIEKWKTCCRRCKKTFLTSDKLLLHRRHPCIKELIPDDLFMNDHEFEAYYANN